MTIQLDAPLYVAGHRHFQNYLAELGAGVHRATLVRDPGNTHDPNAIAVHSLEDTTIGHVPRWRARDWAPLMDAADQDRVSCVIEVVAPPPNDLNRGLYSAELIEVAKTPQ